MARLCGACCGLLIFSAMIVGGLASGNPATRIMIRAMVGLGGGYLLGVLVGWIGAFIVNDQLDRSISDDAASLDESEASNSPMTTPVRS